MRKFIFVLSAVGLFSCVDDRPSADPGYDFSAKNIVTFKGTSFDMSEVKASKEAGFKSFDDFYQTALSRLELVTTEAEQQLVFNEFGRFVMLKDETYEPRMFIPMYRSITNADRLYVANGFLHKVIDDNYIIFTEKENVEELLRIESIEGVDENKFRVRKYLEAPSADMAGRTKANCGAVLADEYFKNVSGCNDDRKAWIHAAATWTVASNYYTPLVAAWCDATRRNGLCNFNTYQNVLYSKDAEFTVRVNAGSQVYYFPIAHSQMPDYNGTSEEWEHFIYGWSGGQAVGSPFHYSGVEPPVIQFHEITMRSSSQGVGADDPTHWAELNCH